LELSDLLVIEEQIRAGDESAFDALFTAWYGKLQAYAFSVLQNESQAEEVVQTVFCPSGKSGGNGGCIQA
jgi:RNA polymerase sigma-70 factor (ECF subfamily)